MAATATSPLPPPLSDADKDLIPGSKRGMRGVSPGRRVLVMDDNADAAQILALLLETLGHTVEAVYTTQAAVDVAKKFKPDVLMLDIGIPGDTNGYEICQRLRADPDLRNAVFVAQTGWGEDEHKKMSREAGFDHHLVKPIKMDELIAVLKKN